MIISIEYILKLIIFKPYLLWQIIKKMKIKISARFSAFFWFRADSKKVTSRAELKIFSSSYGSSQLGSDSSLPFMFEISLRRTTYYTHDCISIVCIKYMYLPLLICSSLNIIMVSLQSMIPFPSRSIVMNLFITGLIGPVSCEKKSHFNRICKY